VFFLSSSLIISYAAAGESASGESAFHGGWRISFGLAMGELCLFEFIYVFEEVGLDWG
jgi:hypothetical protein